MEEKVESESGTEPDTADPDIVTDSEPSSTRVSDGSSEEIVPVTERLTSVPVPVRLFANAANPFLNIGRKCINDDIYNYQDICIH